MTFEIYTIDADRLNYELAELGEIGLADEGGYYIEAFSLRPTWTGEPW